MSELGAFQKAFVDYLFDDPRAASAAALGRGLAVHRNTIIKALVDALEANYPTVAQLVGEEWFRAGAAAYARENAPGTPVLALYGEAFPRFLATFEPGRELPYLAEVARIDRLWSEAHAAREMRVLAPDALSRLSPATLFRQHLTLHPATRFGRFQHCAVTIWAYHRAALRGADLAIDDRTEGALITRPRGPIEWARLDLPGFTFLQHLRGGASLGEAATAALEIDRTADIAKCLAELIANGAFAPTAGDSR
jgi:hypothetical protein